MALENRATEEEAEEEEAEEEEEEAERESGRRLQYRQDCTSTWSVGCHAMNLLLARVIALPRGRVANTWARGHVGT